MTEPVKTSVEEIIKEAEAHMKGAVGAAKKEFAAVRTGRANPALLERVTVDYYGTPTPLPQLATISAPEPRLLVIHPWDKNVIKDVDKAIRQSDLGFSPSSDGGVLRISVPPLTEERRKELVRLVRKEAEEKRVAVRNVRRDANERMRSREKAGDVTTDASRRATERIQELTDRYIKEIDAALESKEREIMEV